MNLATLARRTWATIALPLVAIALSLVVGYFIIIFSELAVGSGQLSLLLPLEAYAGLIQGAIGSPTAIVGSLVAAAPLVLGGRRRTGAARTARPP